LALRQPAAAVVRLVPDIDAAGRAFDVNVGPVDDPEHAMVPTRVSTGYSFFIVVIPLRYECAGHGQYRGRLVDDCQEQSDDVRCRPDDVSDRCGRLLQRFERALGTKLLDEPELRRTTR
jgi:hypothetical protein